MTDGGESTVVFLGPQLIDRAPAPLPSGTDARDVERQELGQRRQDNLLAIEIGARCGRPLFSAPAIGCTRTNCRCVRQRRCVRRSWIMDLVLPPSVTDGFRPEIRRDTRHDFGIWQDCVAISTKVGIGDFLPGVGPARSMIRGRALRVSVANSGRSRRLPRPARPPSAPAQTTADQPDAEDDDLPNSGLTSITAPTPALRGSARSGLAADRHAQPLGMP